MAGSFPVARRAKQGGKPVVLLLVAAVLWMLSPSTYQAGAQAEDQYAIVPGQRLGDRLRLALGTSELDRMFGTHELQPSIHRNAWLWREIRVFGFVCEGTVGTLGAYEPRTAQDPLERMKWRTKDGIGLQSTMGEAVSAYGTPAGQYGRIGSSSTEGQVPVTAVWWVEGPGAGLFAEFRRAAPQRAWALAVFRKEGSRCF